MATTRTTMLQLGYLGLLPFMFSLLLIVTERTLFNLSGEQFFIAYSAVILSFLSGVLWGNAIDHFYHRLSVMPWCSVTYLYYSHGERYYKATNTM